MKSLAAVFTAFMLFICAYDRVYAETWSLPSTFDGESLLTGQKLKVLRVNELYKGLVIVFMSTKCPCSNSHVDLIKKLSEKHKDFRFLVIHSNPEETKSEAQTYFKVFSPPIEVLQDEKTKIADLLKAYKTPHSFVLNAKGEIVYRGGVTDSAQAASAERQYLAEVLQDLSEGKPARLSQGRTLGCVISREGEKNVF